MKRLANEYVSTMNGQAELEEILKNTKVEHMNIQQIKAEVYFQLKEETVKFHKRNYELLVSLCIFCLLLIVVMTFHIPTVFDWFDKNVIEGIFS